MSHDIKQSKLILNVAASKGLKRLFLICLTSEVQNLIPIFHFSVFWAGQVPKDDLIS